MWGARGPVGLTDHFGEVHNFDALCGILLSDVPEPMAGESGRGPLLRVSAPSSAYLGTSPPLFSSLLFSSLLVSSRLVSSLHPLFSFFPSRLFRIEKMSADGKFIHVHGQASSAATPAATTSSQSTSSRMGLTTSRRRASCQTAARPTRCSRHHQPIARATLQPVPPLPVFYPVDNAA